RQNKTDEAIQFARRAASAAEQAFGQDHPDTRKYAQLVQELDSQGSGADEASVKPAMQEYNAAEAKTHIGETARVTDKVGCVLANRNGGYNVGLGDCDGQTPFWVVTHGDISGPKLDVSELKGMVISVTGRIDNESGVARIFIKSTSQIAPRRAATAADQAFGQNHPDTRKYAELVQELDSQR